MFDRLIDALQLEKGLKKVYGDGLTIVRNNVRNDGMLGTPWWMTGMYECANNSITVFDPYGGLIDTFQGYKPKGGGNVSYLVWWKG